MPGSLGGASAAVQGFPGKILKFASISPRQGLKEKLAIRMCLYRQRPESPKDVSPKGGLRARSASSGPASFVDGAGVEGPW